MKTKLVVLSLLLFSFQLAKSQIIKAGVNLANVSITNDGDVDDNKMLTSFHVGFVGDLKIASILYFQPGIIFSGKGSKTQAGQSTDATYYRATTNPFYIEIPATFLLKTPTGPVKFFGGIGPYLAIGIAGKNKVDGKFLGTSFSSNENIKWSDDDPSTLDYEEGAGYGIMKRFDYGINGIVGIEFAKTILSLQYGHGLAKLQSGSTSSSDDNNKHRVFGLSLGIKL
ncbi:MAG TPA: porin family protein [Chitinophagaceae bacterium]|nr:porin family protein [Chitinophagaceae bacterium]